MAPAYTATSSNSSAATSAAKSAQADEFTLQIDEYTCQLLDEDEQPKRIYQAKKDGEHTVECFVEAEEGKSFMLRIARKCTPDSQAQQHMSSVYLGGKYAHSSGLRDRFFSWSHIHKHSIVAQDTVQAFTFAKANVTDDDQACVRDPAKVASIAEVKLNVHKVLKFVDCPPKYHEAALGADTPVWEKSKKVGLVDFGLGETKRQTTATTYLQPFIDRTAPVLEFRFHCSTRFGLEIRKIIPDAENGINEASALRSSSSAAAGTAGGARKRPRDDDIIEIDMEEARLRQELQRLQQRRVALGENSNAGNAGSSSGSPAQGSTSQSSISVKREKKKFDFSGGGTAADPLELIDDDDD
ncbi:hypothetical protein V8E36_009899 [Tilletia maclaganii]